MSRQVHAKTESEWEKALLDKNVHSAMNGPADIFSTRFKITNLYRFDTFHRRKGKTTLNVPLKTPTPVTTNKLLTPCLSVHVSDLERYIKLIAKAGIRFHAYKHWRQEDVR